jgi:hypothetical protein
MKVKGEGEEMVGRRAPSPPQGLVRVPSSSSRSEIDVEDIPQHKSSNFSPLKKILCYNSGHIGVLPDNRVRVLRKYPST